MTRPELETLRRKRDAAEAEADALTSEIEGCLSPLRRIELQGRLDRVVRRINQLDTALSAA
jgi:hypothetical protein